MTELALKVEDLKVWYWTDRGPVKAVDGIDLEVKKGERFGIVGESGCGKSTTAMTLLRLIKPPGSVEQGRILLDGDNLLDLNDEQMRSVRWSRISLIPQGSMNSLNPVVKIGSQITDAVTAHGDSVARAEAKAKIIEMLGMVGLPARVYNMYPHELSGGMKQRVCIAMAIILQPQVIIADEPTSALDVVVQRVVTQTLIKVQERLGAALVIIGHDMGLLAQLVDRLAVMYAGKVAEVSPAEDIYKDPLHPYTQLLIGSVPSVKEKKPLEGIPGLPPTLLAPPPGCIFHPRCPHATERCRAEVPQYREVRPGRMVACHLYE
ncbi:MAG: ABC transporter ATP-binding protein [Spirochaetaceae bacterium]|nr:ABC transporter ATP-binding protein [Spirochaetaceae bacterium]